MAKSAPTDPNAISIIVDGMKWQGWESVSITRGVEVVPSNFTLQGTEKFPGKTGLQKVPMLPGSPCQIMLGEDVVLTGYIDGLDYDLAPNSHTVSVVGRSKLQDLIDCPGFFPLTSNAIANMTLGLLAKQLAAPYAITVSLPDGDSPVLNEVIIELMEPGFASLDRIATMAGFLQYDDVNGNLVIAKVGTNKHASGFSEGVDTGGKQIHGANIMSAQRTFNICNRYTKIAAVYTSTETLTSLALSEADAAGVQGVGDQFAAFDLTLPKRADGSDRFRPLLIMSQQQGPDPNFMQTVCAWEMARRVGRSQAVQLTCDSWRDSAGELWTPNKLVPFYSSSLKSTGLINNSWIIASVTYIRDAGGTRADVVLMPPEAFTPQPNVLNTYTSTLAAAVASATGAGTPTGPGAADASSQVGVVSAPAKTSGGILPAIPSTPI